MHIVFTQGHNKTYNSITTLRHCRCHCPCPRRILPCLEPRRWNRVRLVRKDAWRHKWTSKWDVHHLLILRMEQLKVDTNDLSSVIKKKVHVASESSTKAFPPCGACPPDGGVHGGGGQYPCPEGGRGVLKHWHRWLVGGGAGQYPAGGGGVGHVRGYPATGDPPRGIMGVGPIWEPCKMKVWLVNE
jgi:hypothetical protein